MKFRQNHKDEIAESLQGAGLPREEVTKVVAVIEEVFASGAKAGKTLDTILASLKKTSKEPATV